MIQRRRTLLPLIALCVSILLHLLVALGDTTWNLIQAAQDEQDRPAVTATHRKLHSQSTDITPASAELLAGVQPVDTLLVSLGQPPAARAKVKPATPTAPVEPAKPAAAAPAGTPPQPATAPPASSPTPDATTVAASTPPPPPSTQAAPQPVAPAPQATTAAAPPSPPQAARPVLDGPFPRSVDITYIIKGIVNAEHRWRVDSNRYRIRTTGALFGTTRDWQSEGTLDQHGLRPTRYVEYWDNPNQPKFSVDFDWDNHVAHFGDNAQDKDVPLEDGAEDVFAAAYQFALLGDKLPTFTMQVFTGRKAYKIPFALKGEARLTLSGQPVSTLVLAGSNDQKHFEFYLAPDWHNLPVRIYYTDGSKSYDLIAVKVAIDGKVVLERFIRPTHDH